MNLRVSSAAVIAVYSVCDAAWGHDAYLPLHEHNPAGHSHGMRDAGDHHGHDHGSADGKNHAHLHETHAERKWVVATGTQYTRYSVEGTRSELWETGLGFELAVLPWLHVGGDVSYGWFDSHLGNSSGWLMPHAHVDAHIPLGKNWELLVGGTAGFPGGDEALVGDHWEWEPHLEVSYDRHQWFIRAGAGLLLLSGGSEHEDGDEHAHEEEEGHEEEEHEHHEEEEAHSHAHDFHEIVHPHGERELNYYGAAGVRLLDERLSVEARLSGVHVLRGDTEDRNYLRAGLLASLRISEQTSITAQVSVPISDAERNQARASLGVRVEF